MRVDGERDRAGEEVILPDIWWNRGEASAGMDVERAFDAPIDLHSGSDAIEIGFVSWLRVIEILLHLAGGRIDLKEARGALGAFGDGRIDLPAQAVIEGKAV